MGGVIKKKKKTANLPSDGVSTKISGLINFGYFSHHNEWTFQKHKYFKAAKINILKLYGYRLRRREVDVLERKVKRGAA